MKLRLGSSRGSRTFATFAYYIAAASSATRSRPRPPAPCQGVYRLLSPSAYGRCEQQSERSAFWRLHAILYRIYYTVQRNEVVILHIRHTARQAPERLGIVEGNTHMNLTEYAQYDGLGLAELVAKKQVSPKELAQTAAKAIEAANPDAQRRRRDLSRPHRGPRRNHARQRPLPRRAAPHQGRVRPRAGPQNRVRLPAVQGHGRGRRHLPGRHAQGRGRQHHRPLGGAGILDVRHDRERHVRQYVEPLEERLLGRRLLRRRAGGRHLRHGAASRTAPTSAARSAFRPACAAASA